MNNLSDRIILDLLDPMIKTAGALTAVVAALYIGDIVVKGPTPESVNSLTWTLITLAALFVLNCNHKLPTKNN